MESIIPIRYLHFDWSINEKRWLYFSWFCGKTLKIYFPSGTKQPETHMFQTHTGGVTCRHYRTHKCIHTNHSNNVISHHAHVPPPQIITSWEAMRWRRRGGERERERAISSFKRKGENILRGNEFCGAE